MTFLVRKLRTLPDLRRFKIVVVTDRTDLQEQLAASAVLSGEQPRKANSVTKLHDILQETGPDLVFAMIQKYRGAEEADGEEEASYEQAAVANDSTEILVLVDEAHRSHASALHANLRRAMPNCVMIGFTGTPILEEDKKQTEAIFGSFIDTYTLKQSEADGATLPIRYEGWEAKGLVIDGQTIDGLFDTYFAERTVQDRRAIQGKYANRFRILEAQQLIEMKAGHMLRHYIDSVLPCGFKAQVVAVSRKAAVRYRCLGRRTEEPDRATGGVAVASSGSAARHSVRLAERGPVPLTCPRPSRHDSPRRGRRSYLCRAVRPDRMERVERPRQERAEGGGEGVVQDAPHSR